LIIYIFLLFYFFFSLVYKTLLEICQTPTHLFAFIYYRKYLLKAELNKLKEELNTDSVSTSQSTNQASAFNSKLRRGFGNGFRKAVTKWYNSHSEEQLLRLITSYRRSHSWSNKDLFKLVRIKPKNNGYLFKRTLIIIMKKDYSYSN
jgi:60 kDa SS-A/Ro ribonucleoprotein